MPTILGVDPGTRFLGAAVISGPTLLGYGVHLLINGRRPHDAIGQARRTIFRYIERHSPDLIAIEAPYRIATDKGAILTVLAQELGERARELGIDVVMLSPEAVRRAITGNERATKYGTAQKLVAAHFPELRHLVPSKPIRPALWLSSRERYWQHMFDALALAQAVAMKSAT